MARPGRLLRSAPLVPALLAALLAGGTYLLVGDVNLNLADEGFLWYGVQAALRGEVPMRDFQAYDPGRYLWCAAWSPLFGEGILGVRAAVAVFQAAGLFLGLLVCRRFARGFPAVLMNAAILSAWMFPRHKLFEPALELAAVYCAVRVVEDPRRRSALAAGAFTGLATFFGRNHGLYLVLGFGALGLFLAWKRGRARTLRAVPAFAGGFALGSAPLWGMLLLVPGFAAGFLECTRLNLLHGANLPQPYPWPWRAELGGLSGFALLGELALVAAFLLPVLVYPLGILAALATRRADLERRSVVVAASLVGVFYAHHAAVRSDSAHLAQSLMPLLLLALALPESLGAGRRARRGAWGALAAITLFATWRANPALGHLEPGRRIELVRHAVAGEELRLVPAQAALFSGIEAAVEARVAPGEALFIAPTRPTLYPLLGKPSPVWWIYFFWPASEAEQRETIARLEQTPVNWALIVDVSVDEREELRFRNTNPRVWEHLLSAFEPVADARLPRGHLLFQRRSPR